MSYLRLSALGPLLVTVNGRPASFAYDKVPALLAYLAVEVGQTHRRDSLAELLWPDRPGPTSRHSLSQALTSLRKAIGEQTADRPFITLMRETVQFYSGGDYWLDAAEFTNRLDSVERHPHPTDDLCADCVAQLENAIALYRGDFLARLSIGDSAAFEQWALIKREAFRERAGWALTQLADHYERAKNLDAGCHYARRQIELDPWREAAHRQLMRLLALSGQRSAALAQYERCCQALMVELGIEPEAETTALYEQIKVGEIASLRNQGERNAGPLRPQHNLPAPSTAFIGRETELAKLTAMLADPACRLITLVGPGGIGKTRLALQAALEHHLNFMHGAWLVSLAPLTSPEFMPSALAEALNFTPYGAENLRTQLFNFLRAQQVLVVLDNFEHLLAGATLLTDLLEDAPQLKLLVTSRERLNLRGEWTLEVEGLSFPNRDTTEELERYDAVQLFVQSARRARSSFVLQADNRLHVASVCRLVGGMPLGIELAAAWLPVLSSEEIAREIAYNLDFLAVELRDVPERHRSIRAVFDQSWRLLTEPERVAFRGLSVFRGGFTREAAEAVAGATLVDLSRLTAKSLIHRTPSGRFEVHELLRQYGALNLRGRPDEEQRTCARHGHYYLTFLATREAALKGHGHPTALAEIASEMENIRVAWEWATKACQATLIAQSIDALWLFTEVRGRYSEAEMQFRLAAEALERAPDDLPDRALALGKALACQGSWQMRLGEPGHLQVMANQSLTLLRPLNARREIAFTLNMLAAAARVQGAYIEEGQLLHESIALGQACGDRWIVGYSLNDLGMATFLLGDAIEARRLCRDSQAIFREIGDQRGMAFALNNLGAIAGHLGDLAEADQLLREGLALWRANDHRWGIATTLVHLGVVARLRHDALTARACLLESIQTAMAVRTLPPALDALVEFAVLEIEAGDLTQAGDILLAVRQHPACTAAAQTKAQHLLANLNLSLNYPPADVETLAANLSKANPLVTF